MTSTTMHVSPRRPPHDEVVTTPPREAGSTKRASRGAVIGLSLAMLLPSLDTSIANVALPTLAKAFRAPFGHVQWVVLGYLLAVTTSIVGAGRLGDVFGRRRVLLIGIALFTAASVACGAAPTLGLLIAARAAQGVAAAVLMALTLAVVREAVPQARTGGAMGVLGTMSAVGTALGPTLGGALIATLGWNSIFLINVPLGLLTLALAWRCLPADGGASVPAAVRPAASGRRQVDVLGMVLLALTLAAYALAMTSGRDGFGATQAALLSTAAAGAIAFAYVETRAAAPLIAPALLREPALASGVVMTLLVTTVVMTSLVIGPFHLSGALGLGAVQVGLAMSCGPIAAALTGIPAGRLVDRIGARRTMLAGLVALILGCATLAVMPTSLGVPGYVVPLIVVTAGYALFQAANTTAVMTSSPADQRGVVAAVLTLARNVGLITGAAVMAAVFARAAGVADGLAQGAERVAHGTHVTFAVSAVLMAVALAVAARGRAPMRRKSG